MTAVPSITCPDVLRALPGWLVWRFESAAGEEKPRKVPYYTSGGKRHGVQGRPEDRQQLTTFDAARAAAARRGYDGVGFCPMPEWGIVALDFDGALVDGGLHPDVEALVAGTYAEWSPSGQGVRAFMRGELGNRKDHRRIPFGFETFSSKGFVTFTGNTLPVTEFTEAANLVADVSPLVLDLCMARFGRTQDSEPTGSSDVQPLGLTEAQLREALDVLDASMGHDSWLKIGMALHHETSGEGFELWDEWSSRGVQYPGRDALLPRWDSFGRGGQRPTTANLLVRMANDHGAHIDIALLEADDFDVVGPATPPAAATLEPSTVTYVDFASIDEDPPPPREWVLDQYIPLKTLTTLFGRGGHGKSLLAQQLAVCVAQGVPFAGIGTRQGKVLGFFAEDETDELRRRASSIFSAMGLSSADGSKNLRLDPRPGKNNALFTYNLRREMQPAAFMREVVRECALIKPTLVILDNIAQMFSGNENDRHEVTSFCNALVGVALRFECAVLLLGHVAKADDSEYSGSTAWEAAVRSRLLLARLEDGTTLLRRAKANYSSLDQVLLEWRSGAFATVPGARDLNPEMLTSLKPYIVRAVQVFTDRKQAVSHVPTTRNYIVKLMREEIDLHNDIRKELLEAALRSMLDAREILPAVELPWKTSSRHAVTGLALP